MGFFLRKFSYSIWAFLSIPILALISAATNIHGRNVGGVASIIFMLFTALLVTIPWIVIVRHSAMHLSVAGALFDAIYGVTYFLAFIALGESATAIQWTGAAVTILGIVLMSL